MISALLAARESALRNPSDAEALFALAQRAIDAHEPGEALGALEKAAQLSPHIAEDDAFARAVVRAAASPETQGWSKSSLPAAAPGAPVAPGRKETCR
ncbi:MAG: hypothetical protein HYZ28_18365 [Myxococcales bacterium]|nr:hypothetical protein [Myxococcales bacterium]